VFEIRGPVGVVFLVGVVAVGVWRRMRAGRVECRFVLRFVCCADLTVVVVLLDVDWDMERTENQYTL